MAWKRGRRRGLWIRRRKHWLTILGLGIAVVGAAAYHRKIPRERDIEDSAVRRREPDRSGTDAALRRFAELSVRPSEAISYLAGLVRTQPVLYPLLVELQRRRNDRVRASSLAREGIGALRFELWRYPEWVEGRIALAQLQAYLEDFSAALATLQAHPGGMTAPEVRVATVRIYLLWHDSLAGKKPADETGRIELLHAASELEPGDPDVLARLGSVALADSDYSAAIEQFSGVLERSPNNVAAANNLAWALANSPQPDLDRAAAVIDTAVRLAPNHPEVRETRGQILAMVGDYWEAIPDLEAALAAFPARSSIHETLATAYDQLGEPTMARHHRSLVVKGQ